MKKFLYRLNKISIYSFGIVYAQDLGDEPIQPPTGFVPGISAGAFISGLIGLIIVVAFLAAFIYLLWGGFKWITSGGDEANVEAARNQITQALIGLVIVVAAWAIIQIMQGIFGITILGENLDDLFRRIGLRE